MTLVPYAMASSAAFLYMQNGSIPNECHVVVVKCAFKAQSCRVIFAAAASVNIYWLLSSFHESIMSVILPVGKQYILKPYEEWCGRNPGRRRNFKKAVERKFTNLIIQSHPKIVHMKIIIVDLAAINDA
jgi:hypothetical protein